MKIKILQTILAMGMAVSSIACQLKGMYLTENGTPVPYNISLIKKSERDTMVAKGPGYEFYSETINGDETVVPKLGIQWWGATKIAGILAGVTKTTALSKDKVAITASNNATKEVIAKTQADTTVSLAETAAAAQ